MRGGTIIPRKEWGFRGRESHPVVEFCKVVRAATTALCGVPLRCNLVIDSVRGFATNAARKGVEVGCHGPDLYVCFPSESMRYMIVLVEFVSEAALKLASPGEKAPVQLTFNCYYREHFVRERRVLWNRCSAWDHTPHQFFRGGALFE